MKIRNEPSPLPTTRKMQLGIILKEHFFDVVICSFYIFAFAFPLFFWLIYINLTNVASIDETNYLFNSLIINLPLIPGIMLFGLGIGGSLFFFKKLAFNEGSNVHTDFFLGIKKNYKQSLLSFFVVGLTYSFLCIAKNVLIFGSGLDPIYIGIITGIMYVLMFFVLAFTSFIMTQSIIYNATQGQLFANAFRFIAGKPLKNLGIFVIMFVPFILYEFLPFNIAHWIIFGVCAIWHFGFSSLIFSLYSFYMFDLTLNKTYVEIFRKGLREE